MATYSEPMWEKTLPRHLDGVKRALVIGCGTCANYSLGFYHKMNPVVAWPEGERCVQRRWMRSLATRAEAAKIKRFLEERGIFCRVRIGTQRTGKHATPCKDCDLKRAYFCEAVKGFDIVITLCCGKGIRGIREAVGREVRLVPAMKQIGHLKQKVRREPPVEYLEFDQCVLLPGKPDGKS